MGPYIEGIGFVIFAIFCEKFFRCFLSQSLPGCCALLAVILCNNGVTPNILLPEFARQKGGAHRFCALPAKTLFYEPDGGPVCGPRHSVRSLKNAVATESRDYDEVSESIGLPTRENGTDLPDQPSTFGTRM